MPLQRKQKEAQVAAVSQLLQHAAAVYLTDFKGLTVEEMNRLRGEFHESEVKYRVVKNTLLRHALTEAGGFDGLLDFLNGPTAVALSETPATPARVIKRFHRDTNQLRPTLKAAWVDGAVFADDQIDTLAALKSKEDLLGDVVGLLLSPMSNVVGALQAPGAALAGILETLQDKAED